MKRLPFYLLLALLGSTFLWLPLFLAPPGSESPLGEGFRLPATLFANAGYIALLLVHRTIMARRKK